jgi:hypothetical protein
MSTFEEKVAELREQGIEIDRPVPESEGWKFGERVFVIDDDRSGLAFAGDEGIVLTEEVGDPSTVTCIPSFTS